MNTFKKFMAAAAFLCAATVASAEEDIRVGFRVGYSMQSVISGTGMLGLGAGLGIDIPVGPVFISPEAAFLHRNNWSADMVVGNKVFDWTQPEYAISIPLMIKFRLGGSLIGIGAQVDIPISAEECFDSDCASMDGKEAPRFGERAGYDAGIVLSFGYIITPDLVLDFRYVYGITPHHTYELPPLDGKIKSDPMNSYGFGLKYCFL